MVLYNLFSPDGRICLRVTQTKDGGLSWSAALDGKRVVGDSPLGLVCNLGKFTKGLALQSKWEKPVRDDYTLIGAKQAEVTAAANELVLSFEKKGILFLFIARAYADGIAFRYSIQGEKGKLLRISAEESGLLVPPGAQVFAMPYTPNHEDVAQQRKSPELKGEFSLPILYQTEKDGSWALLNEAAPTGEYFGASVKGQTDGLLRIGAPPEQKKLVETTLPFFTPWRYVVLGDLAAVAQNTMAETLSPPCALDDTDWIRPGVTAWTWLCRERTDNLSVYKKYIDLAAEMRWRYLLMDEGWQPRVNTREARYDGYYPWMRDLVEYAREKRVGLILWLHHCDLDTPEKQKKLLDYAKMGIRGVKVDFFDSQSQDTMRLYERLQRLTAELQLLFNPHGANKSMGERRTWPHNLTREGIFGQEQELGNRPDALSAQHNCTLPFTRCAVGAADYTPMLSYRNSGSRRPFTILHMAALSVVLESGIPCLADRAETYRETPLKPFFTGLPAAWTETRLLEGAPGEYATIARKCGELWYIGAICDAARTAEIPLRCLGAGEFRAEVYRDGETRGEVVVQPLTVTKETVLSIPLQKTGGVVLRIAPVKEKKTGGKNDA